jgi:hypothetical protein
MIHDLRKLKHQIILALLFGPSSIVPHDVEAEEDEDDDNPDDESTEDSEDEKEGPGTSTTGASHVLGRLWELETIPPGLVAFAAVLVCSCFYSCIDLS